MKDNEEQNQTSESDWLDDLAEAAVPSAPAAVPAVVEPVVILPPLDRERPVRPPLVPRAVWMWAGGAFGALLLIALVFVLVSNAGAITVPDVTGNQLGAAKTTLDRLGLRMTISENRLSTRPKGEVLAQTPAPGSELGKGDTVSVVVSAGTEDFPMPDVVGNGQSLAKGVLEAKGLVVVVETVTSTLASDTVIATDPAAGATVRTGQRVKIMVASAQGSSALLQPYRLVGLSVVIDPAPGVTSDPALDVARRLRALLEASGASVRLTRTGSDTSTAEPDRAARVAESSSTVGVGLQITEAGPGGRIISAPATLTAFIGPSSSALANSLEKSFAGSLDPYSRVLPSVHDPVLGAVNMPWVRITLGSAAAVDDASSFADPGWADIVARAIYRSLGEVYGTLESL